MTNRLVIIGAGGFGRETAQAALAAGRHLAGHLDDDPALWGKKVDGVPVLGGTKLVQELPRADFVVCVGNPRDPAARARLVQQLGLPEKRYTTVVHPTAVVSPTSTIGPGTVLLAHTVLTASVRVGRHVAVMPQTVLTHDDQIADFATLASGVRVGGAARIGRGVYLGAGSLVRENLEIGDWSLIGMGAVVLGNVPPGEVWVGNPAVRLREAPPPGLEQLQAERDNPSQGAEEPSQGAEAQGEQG
ncbi:acetyltransferase [Streptomyces sp. NPDC012637]|uniref:acetyltransferase n=1 Tax=Streptomyces sp. NPDC012637 TaxID=3364842 RepID=UPI0036EC5114